MGISRLRELLHRHAIADRRLQGSAGTGSKQEAATGIGNVGTIWCGVVLGASVSLRVPIGPTSARWTARLSAGARPGGRLTIAVCSPVADVRERRLIFALRFKIESAKTEAGDRLYKIAG